MILFILDQNVNQEWIQATTLTSLSVVGSTRSTVGSYDIWPKHFFSLLLLNVQNNETQELQLIIYPLYTWWNSNPKIVVCSVSDTTIDWEDDISFVRAMRRVCYIRDSVLPRSNIWENLDRRLTRKEKSGLLVFKIWEGNYVYFSWPALWEI